MKKKDKNCVLFIKLVNFDELYQWTVQGQSAAHVGFMAPGATYYPDATRCQGFDHFASATGVPRITLMPPDARGLAILPVPPGCHVIPRCHPMPGV